MLRQLLVEEIKSKGPLPFDRFVELCLYHREFGYYCSKRVSPRPAEDFVTAPELTPAFGRVVAARLERAFGELGFPRKVLELGGGKGFLAKDLLSSLELEEYLFLEKREPPLKGVKWLSSLEELPPGFEGVVVANEFFDAFPFKRILKKNGRLFEVAVTLKEGRLAETLVPYEGEVPCPLEEGREYPLFVSWEPFLKALSEKLGRAFLLVFDYGDRCPRLTSGGSPFRAFRNNRLVEDYLEWENLGKTDLTASVDFSYLSSLLEGFGFRAVSLRPQSSFLLEEGLERFVSPQDAPAVLTLLVDMGRRFKVLEATYQRSPLATVSSL